MIDSLDEAHLLYPLEVEIMHLIHDLGHPHVNVLNGQRRRGRPCRPGRRGKLLGRSKILSSATHRPHRRCRLRGHGGLVPRLEEFQAARVNGIIQDVPMAGISHGQGHSNLRCFLQLGWQYLVLHGSPVEGGTALKAGNSHLGNQWILTCNDDLMEMEAPKVSCRSGNLRVRDVLRCLHIKE